MMNRRSFLQTSLCAATVASIVLSARPLSLSTRNMKSASRSGSNFIRYATSLITTLSPSS
ncbi:MAG: twin-arginine translocation signal domain-containing protein [Thermoguttaceae bacterium]|nr:twin-arginine translocation signal domain-containing protein [Thermoguttaceae bacterium]